MALIIMAVAACVGAGAAVAQTQTPADLPLPSDVASKDISVGMKVAPPFAFKLQDGTWSGLSIDLWQKIAGRLNLRFHYVEVPGVQDQIDGVVGG
ncbi:transporter substrate-binding domain-containing protein, partial [Mesorhizobium sp. M00.F.Ca.ET.217.01.1.1]